MSESTMPLCCECSRCVEWKALAERRAAEAAERAEQRDAMRREVVTLENRVHALETALDLIAASGPLTPYEALERIRRIALEARRP